MAFRLMNFLNASRVWKIFASIVTTFTIVTQPEWNICEVYTNSSLSSQVKTITDFTVYISGSIVSRFLRIAKPKSVQQDATTLKRILCNICGKNADFECSDCVSESFCIDCDKIFHRHPLRTKHLRSALECKPKLTGKNTQNYKRIYNEALPPIAARKTTSNDNNIVDLSVPTTNKVVTEYISVWIYPTIKTLVNAFRASHCNLC